MEEVVSQNNYHSKLSSAVNFSQFETFVRGNYLRWEVCAGLVLEKFEFCRVNLNNFTKTFQTFSTKHLSSFRFWEFESSFTAVLLKLFIGTNNSSQTFSAVVVTKVSGGTKLFRKLFANFELWTRNSGLLSWLKTCDDEKKGNNYQL